MLLWLRISALQAFSLSVFEYELVSLLVSQADLARISVGKVRSVRVSQHHPKRVGVLDRDLADRSGVNGSMDWFDLTRLAGRTPMGSMRYHGFISGFMLLSMGLSMDLR